MVEEWTPAEEGVISKPYLSNHLIDFLGQKADARRPEAKIEAPASGREVEQPKIQMVLTDSDRQQHLIRSGSRATSSASKSPSDESENTDGFLGSWRKSIHKMFSSKTSASKSFLESDYFEIAFDLLELSLAVCDAEAEKCRDFALKISEDRKISKALKRLVMLARVVGLVPQGMAESFAGGPLSSQLLAPVRDLAKAFVQDDMTAVDGYFEPGAPLNEMEMPTVEEENSGEHVAQSARTSLAHSSSVSSADGTIAIPRPAGHYQHSSSIGSDGTLGLPRKLSLKHSSSAGSCDGNFGVARGGSIHRGSSLGSADGTLGLPRLLGLNHSNSNLSRLGHSTSNLGSDYQEDPGLASRLRRGGSNCSNGPNFGSFLGRRLGLMRSSSTSSRDETSRPLGLYRGTSTTSSANDSEHRRAMDRSTSNFSSFSCTSLADFNQKHGLSCVESPSFLQFLATVHEATKSRLPRPRRLTSIQEAPLDHAFSNGRELDDADFSDKMSYYSAQEMGKASVFELITSQGTVTLSTRCLKTQAAWQRSLIEQQRSLLVLVSRKLHQAEEKTKLDIAVSEDQRELLRNFRKIVTRNVDNEEGDLKSKELLVIIVESCPLLRAEIGQLCQLLEYRCKMFGSLTAAESEISNIIESAGEKGAAVSPTLLVLLGTSWLDRELPYQLKQESVYVTLTSRAEEFELVGNELSASSESQIRSVLRERGIREYLLHPLSLEDMRRTAEAALQRRWAEEFLVCETLGRGSSGVVHRVKRLRDGHIFAMKEVPTRLLREKDRASLLQEVSLMQNFSWPSIVSLVCAWENRQQRLHYMVMPFSDGGSLKGRISSALVAEIDGGPEPCQRSNSSLSLRGQHLGAWYVQSLHGLSFLHYHGVLHRDIKPDNLMLGHGGTSLQICDLGSAMRLATPGDKDCYVEAAVTTPLYSAPEVSKWKRCYAASDVWSLGATFYEVATLQSLAPMSNPQELCGWLDELADSLHIGSSSIAHEHQKAVQEMISQPGVSGDYDFCAHGQLEEVLRISHEERPSAASILASSSNMSVLRSAMAVSRSTIAEVEQQMKETKRLLQKALHAQGLRSRSICKL